MKKPLRKVQLYESIMLGPTATTSVDVEDPNQARKNTWAGLSMELEDSSGLITIRFRGQEIYLHISACRQAFGLGTVAGSGAVQSVTKYDPNAQDDDDDESPGNVAPALIDPITDPFNQGRTASFAPSAGPSDEWTAGEDPDEFEDPPVVVAKRKPGRPKKAAV